MEVGEPFISVILINWNGKRFLKPCVDSVLNQTYGNYDVILIDNASTDNSVGFIKENYATEIKNGRLKLIASTKNYGFAEGNNVGIRHAFKNPRVEYIATLNIDTVAEKDWLEKLANASKKGGKIGMLQGKILHMDKKTIDSTGLLLYKSGTWYDRGENELDMGQYDSMPSIFGVCAAAALYKRKMLEELEPRDEFFDGDFFGYCEDVDLSIRARLLGWGAIYVPGAVVYHRRGGTTGPESDFQIYHFNRNNLWVIMKTLPSGFVWKNLFSILLSQLGGIFISVVKGRPFPVLRAKLDAVKALEKTFTKRKAVFKEKRVEISHLVEEAVFPPPLIGKYLFVHH